MRYFGARKECCVLSLFGENAVTLLDIYPYLKQRGRVSLDDLLACFEGVERPLRAR